MTFYLIDYNPKCLRKQRKLEKMNASMGQGFIDCEEDLNSIHISFNRFIRRILELNNFKIEKSSRHFPGLGNGLD